MYVRLVNGVVGITGLDKVLKTALREFAVLYGGNTEDEEKR